MAFLQMISMATFRFKVPDRAHAHPRDDTVKYVWQLEKTLSEFRILTKILWHTGNRWGYIGRQKVAKEKSLFYKSISIQ